MVNSAIFLSSSIYQFSNSKIGVCAFLEFVPFFNFINRESVIIGFKESSNWFLWHEKRGIFIPLTLNHFFMTQFTFSGKILKKNENLINFLSKKTVFNYLDVLFLKSKNFKDVEVTNSSTIGPFNLSSIQIKREFKKELDKESEKS